MDKFIQIIEANDLQPEEIESVKAQPHPVAQFKFRRENRLRTEEDYCFNVRYLLGCAAHRINPSHWHDLDVKQDSRIREFMNNINLSEVINEKDFIKAKRENPLAYQQRVEVVARGRTFKESAFHPKGGWFAEKLRNTDEELIKKFTDNAARILPLHEASKVAQTILKMETLGNVAEVLGILAPGNN